MFARPLCRHMQVFLRLLDCCPYVMQNVGRLPSQYAKCRWLTYMLCDMCLRMKVCILQDLPLCTNIKLKNTTLRPCLTQRMAGTHVLAVALLPSFVCSFQGVESCMPPRLCVQGTAMLTFCCNRPG